MANHDGITLTDGLDLYYETAKNITVSSIGYLYVNKGASVTNTIVNGYMQVYDHGKAYNTVINNGGYVETLKADLLDGTVINSGGELYFQNYLIKNTTVNAGGVLTCEGEEASATTVNFGGTMTIFSEYDEAIKLSGKNVFGGNIVAKNAVAVQVAGEIVFAVNQRGAGGDAIIDDISVFRNGSYSVTVGAKQQEGQYRLAGNAAGFSTTITVKDISYKALGKLSVNGSFSAKGYTYSLLRENNALILNVTGTGEVTPAPEKPSEVTGLGSVVNKYNVALSWDKATAKNSSFEIFVDGAIVASTVSNKYTLKNFAVGDHQVQVRMIIGDMAGEWSDIVSFSVADITAPVLGKVTTTVNDYSGLVSWSGSDNVGIDHYQVNCAGQTQSLSGTSATFENLAPGSYNVEVIAYDAAGNASKAAKAKISVKDVTPPEQITGLAVPVVDSKYKALLSWSDGVDNSGKIASYEIQLDNGKIIKSNKTTLAINNLAIGQHSYTVRAIDKDKNIGEWSEAKAFTVLDTTAPATVSVKAVVAGNTVSLSWKAPKDNVGVTGYEVWAGATPSEMTLEDALSANQSSCLLTEIPKGTYYYGVRAVDAAGNASALKGAKVTVTSELAVTNFAMFSSSANLLKWDSSDASPLALASGL